MKCKQQLLPILSFAWMLLMGTMTSAQQARTISGVVTGNNNLPLAQVSVVALETSQGTVTDASGSYQLDISEKVKTIRFSFIGYKSIDLPVTGNVLNVNLISDSVNQLNDVVVIGYGSVKKSDVTGAISTITTKDFQKGTITSFDQMIAGKSPGISITPNGGHPGSGSTIRIRGISSLSASQDPLVVVDGIPFGGYVNPNDIASVTILKDAASAAIYGSRASGGVILITTKKGSLGQTKVNFNTEFSVAKIQKYVDVLSADQFRNYITNTPYFGFDTLNVKRLGTANTNWQKEIYQNAVTSNNNISVSGGIGWLPYRISAGFLTQQGILKTDKMNRGTGSISLTPSLLKNQLKLELNLNGSSTKSFNANQGAIGSAIAFDPTQSVYADNSKFGNYFQWMRDSVTPNPLAPLNPVALLTQRLDVDYYNRAFGNFKADYSLPFLPELHAMANVGFDASHTHGNTWEDSTSMNAYRSNNGLKGSAKPYESQTNNYFLEYTLNYNKTITSIKSNINAMATYGYYDTKNTSNNYATHASNGVLVPNTTPKFPDNLDQSTLISYIGRLIYTYDDKYTLTASIRRDGSSKFAPATRWGWFPSAALGWNIKKESFLQDSHAISDLKFRLSYGLTGNQGGIGSYGYIPSYYQSDNVSTYQFGDKFYTMLTPSAYDASLKWEQTASANIGLDYGFLDNRIFGSVDVYQKKTTNLLAVVNLPAGTNFTNQITTNVGAMTSKGVEFNLGLVPVRNKNIDWTVNFNASYNHSEITKLTLNADSSYKGDATGGITGATGQTIQIRYVGQEPNTFFVYKQVYDASGKPIEGAYVDLDKNGIINPVNDQYFYKSPYPKWIFGFSTNFNYKRWEFSTTLRANVGNYLYNNVASNGGIAYNMAVNQYLSNAVTDILSTGFVEKQQQSDYYIQNASFLKMDNIGISYDFGKVFHSERANLILSGHVQNVFTVTKYKGLDPEVYSGIDNNIYPNPRVYSLGLNLNF